jgi:WXG100 family type VII secretion target
MTTSDGTLVVSFAALHKASDDIQVALNNLHSQLDQVERDAAPLVASWSGAAREAYDARQTKWRTAAADLAGMLRSIKVAVDQSAADYFAAEQHNRNLFT